MIQLKNPKLFRQTCYIDGRWVISNSDRTIAVQNPVDQALLGNVPSMTRLETAQAIERAHAAFQHWRKKTAGERAALLKRWHQLILENQTDLAHIITYEQGKPLLESKGEVRYAASFIEWFAEEGKRIYGDVIPSPQVDKRIFVFKEPVGVCAAITPWNFPAAMITRKAGAALAAGCTMVAKPAEQTPYTALALAELADQAGFPPGVFSVITGDPVEIGKAFSENRLVRKLSFTGSTQVGTLLMQQCAPSIKKISLELGGHAPFIVFADADLDAAVQGAIVSKYRNTGQTCVCTNRLLIQHDIYDSFAGKFEKAVKALKVAPGFEPDAAQGPLIDSAALAKVEAHITDALKNGAQIITGGKRHALGGTFFEPTILTNVNAGMLIAQEETFGPVAPLFRFHDETEAIEMANNTDYGLVAYFYTRDVGRTFRVAEALEYGMIGINTGLISNEVAPFGGVKKSGIGREGSKYGIEEYLELKYVCLA